LGELPNKEPLINVGILTGKKIRFELYGDFKVSGFENTFYGVFEAKVQNGFIVCKKDSSKLEISNEITFEPLNPVMDSFIIRDVIIGKDFHWQRKEKQRFNHSLKLLKDGNKITVINILPLESYIVSVISSEMSAKSSLQFLKALAIVSRSWILAQLARPKRAADKENYKSSFESEGEVIRWYGCGEHQNYDVCADDHCQRFQGITRITTESVRDAVYQTRGIVLLSNGEICDTRYSKACGGITEDFENVWEPVKHPYLTSVIDYKYEPENFNLDFSNEQNAHKWIKGNPKAFCNTDDLKILSEVLTDFDRETIDFYRWRVEYRQEEVAGIIREKSGIDFGEILDLVPIERGSSARLIKLKIVGTNNSLVIGKELEIRKILSPTHLYSSAIVIDKETGKRKIPEKFIIYGAGWGHGVGLCQIGAAVMSEHGHLFDEILLHYFKNAIIKKIY